MPLILARPVTGNHPGRAVRSWRLPAAGIDSRVGGQPGRWRRGAAAPGQDRTQQRNGRQNEPGRCRPAGTGRWPLGSWATAWDAAPLTGYSWGLLKQGSAAGTPWWLVSGTGHAEGIITGGTMSPGPIYAPRLTGSNVAGHRAPGT